MDYSLTLDETAALSNPCSPECAETMRSLREYVNPYRSCHDVRLVGSDGDLVITLPSRL